MSMPKTTINKNSYALGSKNKIRAANYIVVSTPTRNLLSSENIN